jgi:acetylornithine deacetylase/succinyl-diaminopimelate desuccinylase family protein
MTNCVRLLRDLVKLPSVNPMGRALSGPEFFEYQVTAYLEAFFRELGVRYEKQPIAPLRENIVATYVPPGGGGGRTLLYEAHQDTVPIDNMTIDPFGAVIENGRLYGRGSCDIKGGMAAMLTAFARLVREKPRRSATVIMGCAVDEEFTFRGITELVNRGVRADLAIVAEPTGLDIVHAHKGAVRWHLHTHGRACHSSTPEQGINAIYRMGRVLTGLESYAAELPKTHSDPLLGPPKLSVGRIEGGVSVNTVPERCHIEIDRRVTGGENPAEVPGQVSRYLREVAGIDFPFEMDAPWMCKPPLTPTNNQIAVERLGAAIDRVRKTHRVVAVPYGTDASTLAEAGIPSVVFGPGDIAKAHTADEWVALEEVEQASEILYHLAIQD